MARNPVCNPTGRRKASTHRPAWPADGLPAGLAGWGSALATFGLVQGALYLKAFWGYFGLDPFQFVAVGELALAGLAAMAFVLFLLAVGMLLASWIEARLTGETAKGGARAWVVPIVFFGTLAGLIWWAEAWVALIGMILTLCCALAVQFSPVVPRAIQDSPWMIHSLLLLVYVWVVSSWLGEKRAADITTGDQPYTSILRTEAGTRGDLVLLGRLGDTYALWDHAKKTTTLLPASDIPSLEIARKATSVVPGTK